MMNLIEVRAACEKHKDIVDEYYDNDGIKIRKLVDKILLRLRFNIYNGDFYSLANEIFLDALCRYDGKSKFYTFLYTCLFQKFKTEMTRSNRIKRTADKTAISFEKMLYDDEDFTLLDTISDGKTVENVIFNSNDKEFYSEKMTTYLNKLSSTQRSVLELMSIGYTQNEILLELHIDEKTYNDSVIAIRSYRNIMILL